MGSEATKGFSLLVVDDSALVRRMIWKALRTFSGLTMLEAEDGMGALAAIEHHRFDLVITDVDMPEVDGFALVEAFQKLPEEKRPAVMMMSADAAEARRARAAEAGVLAFIEKPFEPEALRALVEPRVELQKKPR